MTKGAIDSRSECEEANGWLWVSMKLYCKRSEAGVQLVLQLHDRHRDLPLCTVPFLEEGSSEPYQTYSIMQTTL